MIKTTRVFGSLQNNMKKKAGFLLSVIGCSLLLAGLTACNGDESAEKEAAAKIVAEQEAKTTLQSRKLKTKKPQKTKQPQPKRKAKKSPRKYKKLLTNTKKSTWHVSPMAPLPVG